MISDAAPMDRPATTSRKPRLMIAAGVGGALFITLAITAPSIVRWVRADRSVSAAMVRYGTVSRGDLLRDLSVQARVVASLSPTLFSPGPGIVSLRTKAGAQVKKGEVLAIVDSNELTAAHDQAVSLMVTAQAELGRQKIAARQARLRAQQQLDLYTVRLETATRQMERAERTFREGLSSKADYEAAQDVVRLVTIEKEQAQRELEMMQEGEGFELATREQQVRRQESVAGELKHRVDELTIRAPFDGMVATVAVQDRDAVAPNQPIVTVVNLSSLELEIGLPQEYGSETVSGTPASITFLGREYPGKVTAISPEVVSGTLAATVAFDGELPKGLKQSQTVTTRLTFESKRDVLKVPRGAFIEAEGGRAVYVVEGQMATRRAVEIGATSAGEVEVVKGLVVGEKIVTSDTSAFNRAQTVLLR